MRSLIALFLSLPLLAQVRFLPAQKLWVLDTGRSSYELGINEENSLQNVYWGKKLLRDADLTAAHTAPEIASFDSRETMSNEEYPGWGGLRYNEPCVKVTLADGARDLVLNYVSYTIQGDRLAIHTKDIRYALNVDLLYRVYPRQGIIEKRSIIHNGTSQPVNVESAQSGVWYVPPGEGYRLTHLTGRWAGETQIHQEPVEPGKKVLESRRAATPAIRPTLGSRSITKAPPMKNMGASGSALSAGAVTGSWWWSRRRRSRCASPAVSTISISVICSSPAKVWKRRPSTADSLTADSAKAHA